MMKGIEMPINVMIIVVICIIVLLAVVSLFLGVWNPTKGSLNMESIKNNACQIYVSNGCKNADQIPVTGVDDLTADYLENLCAEKYFTDCNTVCMCTGSTGSTGSTGGSNTIPCGSGISCTNVGQCPPSCSRCTSGYCAQ
ncbi:MAG: hypothetical protein V1678_02500 [Candidatus Aenigmatarchaeota archaeon]